MASAAVDTEDQRRCYNRCQANGKRSGSRDFEEAKKLECEGFVHLQRSFHQKKKWCGAAVLRTMSETTSGLQGVIPKIRICLNSNAFRGLVRSFPVNIIFIFLVFLEFPNCRPIAAIFP